MQATTVKMSSSLSGKHHHAHLYDGVKTEFFKCLHSTKLLRSSQGLMSDNIIDNTFMSKNNLTFPQYNQDTKIARDRKSSKCNLSEISYDLN